MCVWGLMKGVDGTFAYAQGWLFIYVENFATEFVSEVAAVCFVAIIVCMTLWDEPVIMGHYFIKSGVC